MVAACTASELTVPVCVQEQPSPSPGTPHLATEEGILSAAANVPDGSVPVLPEPTPASDIAAVLSTDETARAAPDASQDDAAAEAAAIAAASSRADADEGTPNMQGVRSCAVDFRSDLSMQQ